MSNSQVYTDQWLSAQQMKSESFEVPSMKELYSIRKGTCVKVCNGEERFWVQIVAIQMNENALQSYHDNAFEWKFQGKIISDIISDREYGVDDVIDFRGKNILDIQNE